MDPKALQLAQQIVRDNPGASKVALIGAMRAAGYRTDKGGKLIAAVEAVDYALSTHLASDLPVGTVVAGVDSAYIKIDDDKWIGTGGSWGHSDERIDSWLAAGTVQILRIGAGQ